MRCLGPYRDGDPQTLKPVSFWVSSTVDLNGLCAVDLEGLRDIATCLNARSKALDCLGFRERVAKSTVADANEQRDYRL
ncbi:MAG: hypothetical protein K8R57_08230 [Verrucomicrobia bacterium]|nr:hypothetical protein [Verrucomicrobiota bacterium]